VVLFPQISLIIADCVVCCLWFYSRRYHGLSLIFFGLWFLPQITQITLIIADFLFVRYIFAFCTPKSLYNIKSKICFATHSYKWIPAFAGRTLFFKLLFIIQFFYQNLLDLPVGMDKKPRRFTPYYFPTSLGHAFFLQILLGLRPNVKSGHGYASHFFPKCFGDFVTLRIISLLRWDFATLRIFHFSFYIFHF